MHRCYIIRYQDDEDYFFYNYFDNWNKQACATRSSGKPLTMCLKNKLTAAGLPQMIQTTTFWFI